MAFGALPEPVSAIAFGAKTPQEVTANIGLLDAVVPSEVRTFPLVSRTDSFT